ncbi:hypothetical protein GCM10011504_51980 [Siccirubricoccus deserti]|uniref:Dienelactone hydrolase domain-containing protein n=1 Tax=Siccirubricoccus deserti TaxID=2013562 RepID=A0A9X0UFE0_9PROT|nr:hypothetical protein [Siccirubricoccus deserti]MBC4018657.1 hypothetical protein [Siccirubricoccus deserti]GGC67617.1 hypothetical protein GCM10011504_51980 [Siccirubricoccus deserti]
MVITAGAALSSQSRGTEAVAELAPRPLLVTHGTANEVRPNACTTDINRYVQEPKDLILYPGCRHGFDQCREALDRDLLGWLKCVLRLAPGRCR